MVELQIRYAGNTVYLVVEEEIVDFTTKATIEEIDAMVDNWIEENEVEEEISVVEY